MRLILLGAVLLSACGKKPAPAQAKQKFYRITQIDRDGKRTPGNVVRLKVIR